jgi:hypothetical protein
LLAKRGRERTRYNWYLQRNEPEKDTNIEQEIATLRRVIPDDILAREGLN